MAGGALAAQVPGYLGRWGAVARKDDVQEALLQKILELAPGATTSTMIRELAEAYAWTVDPSQAHGAATRLSVSK